MKRFTKNKLLISLLPILLGGCAYNEITEVNPSSPEYIGFSSNTATTRAAVSTLSTMQDDNNGFSVFATSGNQNHWYTDDDGKSVNGSNHYKYSAGSWAFVNAVKWPSAPTEYPMMFYAHYPAAPAGMGPISYDPNGITASYTVQPSGSQVDLLAATVSAASRPVSGVLPLVFQHVLAKVNFGIIAGEGAAPQILSIQVDSVQSTRTYDFTHKTWMGTASTTTSYNYFTGNAVTQFTPTVRDGSTPNAVYTGSHSNHLMMMPQTSPSWSPQGNNFSGGHITVLYRMSTGNSTSGVGSLREIGFASATEHPDYAGRGGGYTGPLFVKAGFPLPSDAGNFVWEKGFGYTYNIGLGTQNSCNGYILDEYYYNETGARTALKLIEVRDEGKTIGSKLQNGAIHVVLDVNAWTDDNSGGDIRLGSIKLHPSDVMFNYTAQTPSVRKLHVQCIKSDNTEDAGASWTLKIPAAATSWVKLSLDGNTSFNSLSGGDVISSTGSKDVFIYATENTTNDLRKAVVTLMITPKDSLTGGIFQDWDINQSGGNLVSPADVNTYVGAFWRANQTGERVININMGTTAGNLGRWRAAVAWMDDRWNEDDIVLAAGGSPNLSDPNAENYQVPGDATTVDGTVSSGGNITFRIGLKSTYDTVPGYPARYAVIMIAYNDVSKVQKLFLRQGEHADYVMRPEDEINTKLRIAAGTSNSSFIPFYSPNRPNAKKFTPYNLTDPSLSKSSAYSGATDIGVGGVSNKFVDYPSKGGYFFQFNYSNQAFNPLDASITGMKGNMSGVEYWNPINHESCPQGYRRPTDGQGTGHIQSISGLSVTATNNNVIGSEMRQSIFINPDSGQSYSSTNVANNSLKGYYADGYFDRNPIQTPSNGASLDNSAVATNTVHVGYLGRLFYNPKTSASLFLPSVGYRLVQSYYLTFDLGPRGTQGYYWTSSTVDGDGAWIFNFKTTTETYAYLSYQSRNSGAAIRCVKD